MLPLDEEYFEIDANKRTITVPTAFKNGVSVQGDIMAETILFRINRFFDAVDFNTCDIWVQWERVKDPSAKYVTQLNDDSAAKLVMLSENGEYLIFGWSLSELVAEVAGQIKFSIRFIKEDGGKIVYSFSTTPVTITINPGLDYDIHNCEPDQPNYLFNYIIENSETSTGPSAMRPIFEENLTSPSYLDENGTAELSVRAHVSDGGTITYEWYYSKEEKAVGENVATITPGANKAVKYIVDGSVEGSDITGFYWAKAINKYGNRQKSESSFKTEFPGPNEPKFNGTLSDAILVDEEAILTLAVKPDLVHGEHNKVDYQWYQKTASTGVDFVVMPEKTSEQLIVTEPGIYKVEAINTVNRQSKGVFSTPCTVYNQPGAVAITDLEILEMYNGQTYTLETTLPASEFARGTVKYSWWLDYAAPEGILDNGIPSESDKKVEYDGDLDKAEITINDDLLAMASGAELYCVAMNTITIGDVSYTTYSESKGYTLKR